MSFLSRFNRPAASKIHTNVFAHADDGSAQALSAMRNDDSFEARMGVENNRQHVQAYKYAALTRRSEPLQDRPRFEPSEKPRRSSKIDVVLPGRQQANAQPSGGKPVKARFSEPTSRGHNPYQ